MAVTAKWYGNALLRAFAKEVNWANDTIKVMLCTDDYTPNQDTHVYKNQVTGEVVGTGYTSGGVALSNKTVDYDATTNTMKLGADNVTWSNSTITARYAIIYNDTPANEAAKPLLGYVDFGKNEVSSNGNFAIQWQGGLCLTMTAD